MAVNKAIESTSISIEVQNGQDKAGDPTFAKKTFSNVKEAADLQAVYDVADAIKNIMDGATRDTLVNVTSSLTQA
ncbi:Conserved hypothetical protein, DUF1659 domain [Clostridium neonatale]|uniref:DUF1659 domain-containing protein n=1 Tax=Clostridium neonatale TaxID=137838 RepID=UPI00291BE482|nr:DUF1659 domain-containing protein [Clostridium neonatale]CAI3671937.1 Conserved hypothetical protein, DUF1659 domain [Clostridium neonatale]